MKLTQVAYTLLALAMVFGVLAAFAYPGERTVTETEYSTATATTQYLTTINYTATLHATTAYKNTTTVFVDNRLYSIVNCSAVSYFQADTVNATPQNVIVISGTVTTTGTTYVYGDPTQFQGYATYTTTTAYGLLTGVTYTQTHYADSCEPSACWTVTLCTLVPENSRG
jgi:hypothetical protein